MAAKRQLITTGGGTKRKKADAGPDPDAILKDLSVSVQDAFQQARSPTQLWCNFLAKELEGLKEEDRNYIRLAVDAALVKVKMGKFMSTIIID